MQKSTGYSMNNTSKNREGFTLVETMVTVVIFAVVMSLALGVFLSTVRNQRIAMHRQRLITETSYVMSKIEEALRKGEGYNANDFHSGEIEITDEFIYPEDYEGEDMVTIAIKSEIKIGEKDEKEEYRLQMTILKRD